MTMVGSSSIWKRFIRPPSPKTDPAQSDSFPQEARSEGHALLAAFYAATTPKEADTCLEHLTEAVILPTLRTVLRQRGIAAESAENLLGTVAYNVVRRLRRGNELEGSELRIENIEGYVAVVTHHAVDAEQSARSPERARLRRSVRYILTHAAELALWERDGLPIAGRQTDARHKLAEISSEELARRAQTEHRSLPIDLISLTLAVLTTARAPVLLETLLEALAVIKHIGPGEVVGETVETAADGPTLEQGFFQKETLEHVWKEVTLLAPRQRAALLLNLRDSSGRGVLELLLVMGLATRESLATLLQWSPEQLETHWNELPLDDNAIATLLGVTRQQVINLRKVARERLERRLARLQKDECQ